MYKKKSLNFEEEYFSLKLSRLIFSKNKTYLPLSSDRFLDEPRATGQTRQKTISARSEKETER